MALTYYIRSWDPRSTYPTNPQEGDICYTITLDQTWAPVGGVKKDNIVKEEIYQNGAWVEQGGGGGSLTVLYDGDFETEEWSGLWSAVFDMYTFIPVGSEPDSMTVVYGGDTLTLPFVGDALPIPGYGEVVDGAPTFDNYPMFIVLVEGSDGTQLEQMQVVFPEETSGLITVSADVGGAVSVESISITENGTYEAPDGKAYSPVEVNVPYPPYFSVPVKRVSGSNGDLKVLTFSDDFVGWQDVFTTETQKNVLNTGGECVLCLMTMNGKTISSISGSGITSADYTISQNGDYGYVRIWEGQTTITVTIS